MRNEVENPMVLYDDVPKAPVTYGTCTCEYKLQIALGYDHPIIIGDWLFATKECVADFFIKEHGGRPIYAL